MVLSKICGLNEPAGLQAALDHGSEFIGLNFYPPSPRALSPAAAAELADIVPESVNIVGLFVDADDQQIQDTLSSVRLDWLQFHGRESPDRVAAARQHFQRPVMKAISIANEADLDRAATYVGSADRLLFDAKPPADMKDALPGGNGLRFDWRLLTARQWSCPWALSGGLDAGNVSQAVALTGAAMVDVSSGVESRPGMKDPAAIKAFLDAVKAL